MIRLLKKFLECYPICLKNTLILLKVCNKFLKTICGWSIISYLVCINVYESWWVIFYYFKNNLAFLDFILGGLWNLLYLFNFELHVPTWVSPNLIRSKICQLSIMEGAVPWLQGS